MQDDIEYIEVKVRDIYNPENYMTVPMYRRSLNAMIEPLMENGFQIDTIRESYPTMEFQIADPEDYEKVSTQPSFICFRCVKKD